MVRLLLFLALLTVAVVPVAEAQAPAELLSRIDALQLQRDNSERAAELDALLTQSVKEHPTDYDGLWRASRFRFWIADGYPDQNPLKVTAAKQAWDLGERAAALSSARPEGHYWAAASLGAYA